MFSLVNYGFPAWGRKYDIAPNGQRFVFLQAGTQPGADAGPPQLILVQNWFEELRQRVPVN